MEQHWAREPQVLLDGGLEKLHLRDGLVIDAAVVPGQNFFHLLKDLFLGKN